MARITLTEQEEFTVFPVDSILLLKVDEVSVQTVPGRNGKPDWQKLAFKFKILDIQAMGNGADKTSAADQIGQQIFGSVPFRLTDHPENKLRQWVEAIFGMPLSVGFELDTDLLEGRTVRGITSQYMKKQDGKEYPRHQIESLLPYGDGVGSIAAVTPKPDPWANEGSGYAGYSEEPPF